VLAAIFYSLPPLRLKERGLPGLVVTILAQQTLPTAMLFAIFGQLESWGALVFVVYATARGMSSDVSHQMRDLGSDAAAGSSTFAVQAGARRVRQLYAASLELERFALGGVLVLLLVGLPWLPLPGSGWWSQLEIAPAWPLLAVYLPLIVLTAGSSLRALNQGRLEHQDPYDEARQARSHDATHFIHHTLPSVATPFYLGLWLTLTYLPNIIFLLTLFMLYGLYSPRRWASTWPLKPLLAYWRTLRSHRERT
jgi:hypothetical protein